MRASVLRHAAANGKKSCGLDTRHRICGLHDEGARLDPFRFFGQRGVFCQLSKAAFRADPHREGINRVRGWSIHGREVIARGLLTEVEGQSTHVAAARSTFYCPIRKNLHLFPASADVEGQFAFSGSRRYLADMSKNCRARLS